MANRYIPHRSQFGLLAVVFALSLQSVLLAQRRSPAPPILSPEIEADGKVTFRIRAPNADSVRLTGSDMPEIGRGLDVERGEDGVWRVTLGPVASGTYRYRFEVDGVAVSDPVNPVTSESNANSWSLVHVPGAVWMDNQRVPHGAVSEVHYYSTDNDVCLLFGAIGNNNNSCLFFQNGGRRHCPPYCTNSPKKAMMLAMNV